MRSLLVMMVVSLGATMFAGGVPVSASAASPEPLWQVPQDGQGGGTAGGELQSPAGVAADPTNGHVYVIEQGENSQPEPKAGNHRISEFTAWGEFVKAFGWGVADGSEELQSCGPGAAVPVACEDGIGGSGPGQLGRWAHGLAVDGEGNLYVYEDEGAWRVQKLDPSAGPSGNEVKFAWMAGGEVNKTKTSEPGASEAEENLCTAAQVEAGDECGAGTEGAGMGQFAGARTSYEVGGSYLDVTADPEGTLYVADKGRVQEIDPQTGAYESEVGLPNGEDLYSRAVAVAPDGSLYFSFYPGPTAGSEATPEHPDVYRRTASGWEVFAELDWPQDLATDKDGSVYVLHEEDSGTGEVLKFSPDGTCEICLGDGFAMPPERDVLLQDLLIVQGLETGSYCGPTDVYASYRDSSIFDEAQEEYLSAYGPLPDPEICPPPANPPQITDQYAISVGVNDATVGAKINPRFWADTTYYVQYGTGECATGGCDRQRPAPPAALGTAASVAVATDGVLLPGLEPGTEYHYRFVSQSSGGGPVFGVGGVEGTFTTDRSPGPANVTCPNDAVRTGASADLPNCRAYEMVSPVDKANGDVVPVNNINSNPATIDRSSLSGERFTYSSYRAFADPQSAPFASQYLAGRDPANGWESESISPPRGTRSLLPQGLTLDTEFRAFSADLCTGWLIYDSQPPLDTDVPPGYASLYRRDNCGGGYRGLIQVEPPNRGSSVFVPEPQAVSESGSVVFRANGDLTPYAPEAGQQDRLLYVVDGDGTLRVVSVLPSGLPVTGSTSAGTANNEEKKPIRFASVSNAISADGSRVFWSDSGNSPGHLYVRINAGQVQSGVSGGACNQPARACTLPVSETVSSRSARFWTAAEDGSRAIFSIDKSGGFVSADLYEFDVESGEPNFIVGEVSGVLGASADASRIYLVTREDRGGEAVAGEPNLYLYEDGAFTFIEILTAADAQVESKGRPSPVNIRPIFHSSRVSSDGRYAVFMSNGGLTGEDNTDANSGEPDAQVYRYERGGSVVCVSCNATNARPAGRNIAGNTNQFWAAAQIPSGQSQIQQPRVLSADGGRVFFESFEPLVRGDVNEGKQDVYQWEKTGTEDCDEGVNTFNSRYMENSGGCVSLISSGQSDNDSRFLDISPQGEDAFFTTEASLVPRDPGLVDVYDARVNGGFAPPPPPPTPCEGDDCQSPPNPPEAEEPESSKFRGPGNLAEPPPDRCALLAKRVRRVVIRARRQVRISRKASRRVTAARRLGRPVGRRNLRRVRVVRRRANRLARRGKVVRNQVKRCRIVQRKRALANRGGAR